MELEMGNEICDSTKGFRERALERKTEREKGIGCILRYLYTYVSKDFAKCQYIYNIY